VSGFFGENRDRYEFTGCIPQLPSSAVKDAFLEVTFEQAMQYWWNAKTYTFDSFSGSSSSTIASPAYGISLQTYSASADYSYLSQDALCRQSDNREYLICSRPTDGDRFDFSFSEGYEGPSGDIVSTATSGSIFNGTWTVYSNGAVTSDSLIAGYGNLGWPNNSGEGNWFRMYCDYTVTPNLYYIDPYIFFRGDVSAGYSFYTVGSAEYFLYPTYSIGNIPANDVSGTLEIGGTYTLNFYGGGSSTCNLYYNPNPVVNVLCFPVDPDIPCPPFSPSDFLVSDVEYSFNASITITSVL